MSKLRLFALVGLLSAALVPLAGCGSECAEGTVDKDGQCVLTANGCADGTRLRDGECMLDSTGCGQGTRHEDGACVPAEESCEGDTKLDEAVGACVPNTDVICGEGTEVDADGWCVPGEQSCADTAALDDQGRCVIAAASCGPGTGLAADTNECVLVDDACAQGLALAGDTATCVPTDQICEAGTRFDADSGLCLNGSCREGDVLTDDVCMTPVEDLARDPDLDDEGENNDPDLGGSARELMTPPAGDDPYVFMATIDEPADLDGDGTVDQDVDVFSFEAEAGEWLQVAARPLGHEALAFIVEGPDDYLRFSALNHPVGATRTIVAPQQGTYTVTVLPSLVVQGDGDVSPMGGADWEYVGSLQALETPDAREIDVTDGDARLSGDFLGMDDNLFELTGQASTEALRLDVTEAPTGARGILQVWSDAETLASSTPISKGSIVDVGDAGTPALVLVDWESMEGDADDFEISATIGGGQATVMLGPDDSESLTVPAEAGHAILALQENSGGETLSVSIKNTFDEEIAAKEELSNRVPFSALAENSGEYTVTFTNNNEANVNATLSAREVPPGRLGELPAGRLRSTPAFELLPDEQIEFEFSVAPDSMVRFGQTNEQDEAFEYEILTSPGDVVAESAAFDTTTSQGPSAPLAYQYFHSELGGTYTFRGTADAHLTDAVVSFENLGAVATTVGSLAPGDTDSFSESDPLSKNEVRFFEVEPTEEGQLVMEALTPGHENVDLFIYEDGLDDASGSSTTPIDEQYLFDAAAETHWIMLHASEALPSYTLDVALDAQAPGAADFTSEPGLHIPDNDLIGISDTVAADECVAVERVEVYADISHTDIGDLHLILTSPNGTRVPLRTGEAEDSEDMVGWFPQQFPVVDNLYRFRQESGNGQWTLTVVDDEKYRFGNTTGGTLNEWGLKLTCQ